MNDQQPIATPRFDELIEAQDFVKVYPDPALDNDDFVYFVSGKEFQKLERELVQKEQEVESFKTNNRYQKGYHDGEKEYWKKVQSLQSERDKLQQENQNLTDKAVQFCGEITELKEERDKLRKALEEKRQLARQLCEALRELGQMDGSSVWFTKAAEEALELAKKQDHSKSTTQ